MIVRSASKVCVRWKDTVTLRIEPARPDTVSEDSCVVLSAIGQRRDVVERRGRGTRPGSP